MVRPLPHVTRRYGRVPSKVKLWITTSVTRQIPAAGPRATAPGTVTWTYASRPSPETSRAAELEFFRDEHGGWRRYEPWMTTLVDADTGRVLGVVDGRDSAGVGTWLAARSQFWRDGCGGGGGDRPVGGVPQGAARAAAGRRGQRRS